MKLADLRAYVRSSLDKASSAKDIDAVLSAINSWSPTSGGGGEEARGGLYREVLVHVGYNDIPMSSKAKELFMDIFLKAGADLGAIPRRLFFNSDVKFYGPNVSWADPRPSKKKYETP